MAPQPKRPPTANSQARERAWLRRQMGYLRVEIRDLERRHDARLKDVEALLGKRHYPAD